MSEYIFTPNDYAKKMFNLVAKEYKSHSLNFAVEDALGPENSKKYFFAQGALSTLRTGDTADVKIITNKEVLDLEKLNVQDLDFQVIGTLKCVKWSIK